MTINKSFIHGTAWTAFVASALLNWSLLSGFLITPTTDYLSMIAEVKGK